MLVDLLKFSLDGEKKKKDRITQWVIAENVATKKSLRYKYALSDFVDQGNDDFYKGFFSDNSSIVKWSNTVGLKQLPDVYASFLEKGFLVAQQDNPKFRTRFHNEYQVLLGKTLDVLSNNVVKQLVENNVLAKKNFDDLTSKYSSQKEPLEKLRDAMFEKDFVIPKTLSFEEMAQQYVVDTYEGDRSPSLTDNHDAYAYFITLTNNGRFQKNNAKKLEKIAEVLPVLSDDQRTGLLSIAAIKSKDGDFIYDVEDFDLIAKNASIFSDNAFADYIRTLEVLPFRGTSGGRHPGSSDYVDCWSVREVKPEFQDKYFSSFMRAFEEGRSDYEAFAWWSVALEYYFPGEGDALLESIIAKQDAPEETNIRSLFASKNPMIISRGMKRINIYEDSIFDDIKKKLYAKDSEAPFQEYQVCETPGIKND